MEQIDPTKLNEMPRILYNEVIVSKVKENSRITLSVPTTGLIRYEWHLAFNNVLIPVCFSLRHSVHPLRTIDPIGFHVAEARNVAVQAFLKTTKDDWLFFIDHDVLLHSMTYARMLEHIKNNKYPIVSGLYYTKGDPSYPLVFRGRGDGPFTDFSINDLVPVDGLPMGCTIIHRSILEYMYDNSQEVLTQDGTVIREVFRSPRDIFIDPEFLTLKALSGTEDLDFCSRVIDLGVLEKTGWSEIAKEEYPFLIDTRIFCGHITPSGDIFPIGHPLFGRVV